MLFVKLIIEFIRFSYTKNLFNAAKEVFTTLSQKTFTFAVEVNLTHRFIISFVVV